MYGEKGLSDQSLVSCYLSVFKANSTLLVQIEFRQTTVENLFWQPRLAAAADNKKGNQKQHLLIIFYCSTN